MVALGNGDFAVSDNDTNGTPSLLLVNPSNPNNIAVSPVPVPSGVHGITISGSELYATSSSGLSTYQINPLVSDPVTVTVNLPAGTAANIVPGSYNLAPNQVNTSSSGDSLVWTRQFAANSSYTFTWQSTVSNVTVGQTIPVTTNAVASFTTDGTPGTTTIPGTSVTGVPQVTVSISPASETVQPGGTATFIIRLTNPTASAATYDVNLEGQPGPYNLSGSENVPAFGSTDDALTINIGASSGARSYPFTVDVSSSTSVALGGSTQATVVVAGPPVVPVQPRSTAYGVVVSLAQSQLTAGQGTSVTDTVQVTNTGSSIDDDTLSVTGLPEGAVAQFAQNGSVVSSVQVQPGVSNAQDVTLTLGAGVTQITPPGTYPFQVVATSQDGMVSDTASGTLTVSAAGVLVLFESYLITPGQSLTAVVQNLGSAADTFNLTLAGPAAALAADAGDA